MTQFAVILLNDTSFSSPAHRSIVGYWYVSNAAMTLATVSATILFQCFFLTVRAGTAYRYLFSCRRYICTCTDMQNIQFKENIIRQFDRCTDSRALRAKYCIVGIPHNMAIYFMQWTLWELRLLHSTTELRTNYN